ARMKFMGQKVKRLFESFRPDNYQLHIVPNKKTLTFKGTVTIGGKKVGRPSQRITLHQKELNVTNAVIMKKDKKGDREISVSRIVTHASYDEVRLHTAELLHAGNYHINLEFEGVITPTM